VSECSPDDGQFLVAEGCTLGVPCKPPFEGYRCHYVTDWVADKTRYGLAVDPSEEAVLSEALSRCPNEPITVTLAR
jgi:hypothetical protein